MSLITSLKQFLSSSSCGCSGKNTRKQRRGIKRHNRKGHVKRTTFNGGYHYGSKTRRSDRINVRSKKSTY